MGIRHINFTPEPSAMFEFILSILKIVIGPLVWRGKLVWGENLPKHGPAVFISNHMDALGPIAIVCSVPLRMKTWMVAEVVDKRLAPAYLQKDFVERQLHFKPPFSRWFSLALCRLTVPFLNAIGSIPVYRGDADGIRKTMEMSMAALRAEKYVLVFPENPLLPADPATKMNPFMHSFVRMAELYYAETGKCLDFYPLTIHPKRYVVVGKPVAFNPVNPVGQERRRLCGLLEENIKTMYLSADPAVQAASQAEVEY
jgi:hypothetical protein